MHAVPPFKLVDDDDVKDELSGFGFVACGKDPGLHDRGLRLVCLFARLETLGFFAMHVQVALTDVKARFFRQRLGRFQYARGRVGGADLPKADAISAGKNRVELELRREGLVTFESYEARPRKREPQALGRKLSLERGFGSD